MSKTVDLSSWTEDRLNRFHQAVVDPDIGKTRAIAGLKSWQDSNKHRLTDADNSAIVWAIRSVS